jgi:5-methylcytosine-specific restriction endonuclease McrA
MITEARIQLYLRSEGRCELQGSQRCWGWISWETMHACHIVSKARGGKFTLSNLKAGCPECHIGWEHAGG